MFANVRSDRPLLVGVGMLLALSLLATALLVNAL
jgi:hypothetical protein